jgi:P-type conjugative transfer protein TrbG
MKATLTAPRFRRGAGLVMLALLVALGDATAQTTTQEAATVTKTNTAADTNDAVASATREYRATGVARTVAQGSFLTVPYGHAQPMLTCTVLRACVIELQPGEIVLSRIAGDTERWEIAPAVAGADGKTTLVVVKPRECDVTTNVVLATNRHLYDLTLDSPPCKARSTNPQEPYVRHIRFYYPDETVTTWTKPNIPPVAKVGVDVATLNFGYEVKKDRKFPWIPAQVFDDGTRVYIKLPAEARSTEAPVLFAIDGDGSKTLINYSVVDPDTYVTDRLFDRAALVAGIDGKERRVLIERKSGGRP